ncbi:MAG: SRPBCC domain-containing protein [Asticcacaulis sp.]
MTVTLEKPASEAKVFAMSRVFDASPELLWDVLTMPEHLSNWFGPPGATVKVASLDLTPGGTFLYGMPMPGGVTMWGKWVFRVIDKPKTLAYVVSFCNEQGVPVRHPMAPLWPLEVLAIQTLTPQAPSSSEAVGQNNIKTLYESRSYPINCTPEERAVFTAGHASMTMGFSGTFMALEAYLAKLKQGSAA